MSSNSTDASGARAKSGNSTDLSGAREKSGNAESQRPSSFPKSGERHCREQCKRIIEQLKKFNICLQQVVADKEDACFESLLREYENLHIVFSFVEQHQKLREETSSDRDMETALQFELTPPQDASQLQISNVGNSSSSSSQGLQGSKQKNFLENQTPDFKTVSIEDLREKYGLKSPALVRQQQKSDRLSESKDMGKIVLSSPKEVKKDSITNSEVTRTKGLSTIYQTPPTTENSKSKSNRVHSLSSSSLDNLSFDDQDIIRRQSARLKAKQAKQDKQFYETSDEQEQRSSKITEPQNFKEILYPNLQHQDNKRGEVKPSSEGSYSSSQSKRKTYPSLQKKYSVKQELELLPNKMTIPKGSTSNNGSIGSSQVQAKSAISESMPSGDYVVEHFQRKDTSSSSNKNSSHQNLSSQTVNGSEDEKLEEVKKFITQLKLDIRENRNSSQKFINEVVMDKSSDLFPSVQDQGNTSDNKTQKWNDLKVQKEIFVQDQGNTSPNKTQRWNDLKVQNEIQQEQGTQTAVKETSQRNLDGRENLATADLDVEVEQETIPTCGRFHKIDGLQEMQNGAQLNFSHCPVTIIYCLGTDKISLNQDYQKGQQSQSAGE